MTWLLYIFSSYAVYFRRWCEKLLVAGDKVIYVRKQKSLLGKIRFILLQSKKKYTLM
jgi:hypothetical protein